MATLKGAACGASVQRSPSDSGGGALSPSSAANVGPPRQLEATGCCLTAVWGWGRRPSAAFMLLYFA